MTCMKPTIWNDLTQDTILNMVEKTISQKLTNLVIQRNSYINRVFELEFADTRERLIVKFYRPNRWSKEMIITEHALLKKLFTAELPVIPPLTFQDQTLFEFNHFSFALFPKKGGRALDELTKEQWQQIGRMIGRFHAVSVNIKNTQRLIWQPSIATITHLDILKSIPVIPIEYQPIFYTTAQNMIRKYDPLFKSGNFILLHGDCHLGNFIYRPNEGISLIDFDDICIGPAIQDMWLLLPDKVANCENEISWFREGYQTFFDFPSRSLDLIPALRAMRIIHFASWCAIQSQEPGFQSHFPEWGSPRYWNETVRALTELI